MSRDDWPERGSWRQFYEETYPQPKPIKRPEPSLEQQHFMKLLSYISRFSHCERCGEPVQFKRHRNTYDCDHCGLLRGKHPVVKVPEAERVV